MSKSSPTGIRKRHSRKCPTHKNSSARCRCRPSWEASVYLKLEAKKVRKSFPTLDSAKAWRADMLGAANRGELRAPTATTLREAADEWIAGAEAGTILHKNGGRYKPSALRSYRRALEMWVLPAKRGVRAAERSDPWPDGLGRMRLSDVRQADVQDLVDEMLGKGRDASTVHNTLDPLRAIFRRAIRRKHLAVNPCADLDLPRPTGRRDRIAGPEEAARLLAAVPAGDRPIWACAMYAGLRRGELMALRWEHVDLAAGVISVRNSWDPQAGELEGGKTKAARRSVPILTALKPILRDLQMRSGRRDHDLVFGVTVAKPFDPGAAKRRALTAWKHADLKPITLHECRHTCASTLIASRVDHRTVMEIMGHASITTTFNLYGHLMPGGLDRARDLVDTYHAREAANP